jgi:DNA polymerase III epsilon subunit-like protein
MDEEEVYISVDIEASGPIPGEYSMLSIGACEIGNMKNSFYAEIQPISEKFVKEALDVCGFSMEEMKKRGATPYEAMRKFAEWIKRSSNGKRPVFVAHGLGFDWSFVNYYFIRFMGANPFSISGIDIKSVWLGKTKCSWQKTSKTDIKRALGVHLEHTHNALEDAKEQAIIFEKLLAG